MLPETSPATLARFWDKVDKSGECWLWMAARNHKGYGYSRLNGRIQRAHRLSYAWENGPIPDGLQVDHTCHVRHCVNPGHLRLVTHKQNMENRTGSHRSNKSGIRGVSWVKSSAKWRVDVCHSGERLYLGLFETLGEAEAAAVAKRNELFTHNDLDRFKV